MVVCLVSRLGVGGGVGGREGKACKLFHLQVAVWGRLRLGFVRRKIAPLRLDIKDVDIPYPGLRGGTVRY